MQFVGNSAMQIYHLVDDPSDKGQVQCKIILPLKLYNLGQSWKYLMENKVGVTTRIEIRSLGPLSSQLISRYVVDKICIKTLSCLYQVLDNSQSPTT
jgi:hypothetical protein